MGGYVWNVVVSTASVLMAWVGFVLSVAATILSVYIPLREETPVLRRKSRVQTVPHPEKRSLPEETHSRSLRTDTTTSGPSTPASISPLQDITDTQSNNASLRSRSCDTSHRLPTSFKEEPTPKLESSFIVFRPVTCSSDPKSELQNSISSKEQGMLFDHPAASPRPHSFHIPAFRRCSDKKRRTSLSISPSRSASDDSLSPRPLSTLTRKQACLRVGSKQLKKTLSVPILTSCPNSTARKITPPLRTRPYEAPYFFPQPSSPATVDYGRQFRATPLRRAATAYEPLASGVSAILGKEEMLGNAAARYEMSGSGLLG